MEMDEIYEAIAERIGDEIYENHPHLSEEEINARIEEIMCGTNFCIYDYLGCD